MQPKTNNTYTTEKFIKVRNGHTYNWTVTANEISDKALGDLAKLILKIF